MTSHNTPPPPIDTNNENCFVKIAIVCVSALCLLFIVLLIPVLIFDDWWKIILQKQIILLLISVQYWQSYLIANDILAEKSPISFFGKTLHFQSTQRTYSSEGFSSSELIPFKSKLTIFIWTTCILLAAIIATLYKA